MIGNAVLCPECAEKDELWVQDHPRDDDLGKEGNKSETGQVAVSTQGTVNPEVKVVTDLVGREVKVKIPAQRIVAIGPGALRLVAYAKGTDRVVGIEDMEKNVPTGRPYMFAYPELKTLPTIGQGGIDSVPDEEALLSLKPDVIFVSYLVDKAKADKLQDKTGIPVVVSSYGQLATFNRKRRLCSLFFLRQVSRILSSKMCLSVISCRGEKVENDKVRVVTRLILSKAAALSK